MKFLISLGFVLISIPCLTLATEFDSSCEWITGKWKCSAKNSWNGSEENIYYNIVQLNELLLRINFHPSQVPESNSPIGFNVYLDGRLDSDIGGRSFCKNSKLVIDYLEDISDEHSVYTSFVFEKENSGMNTVEANYSNGAVTNSSCIKL